jgi:hypothetical protein
MQTYTAIALLSLLGITLSANAALAFETPLPSLETAIAEYMLSAQTQHKRDRDPRRDGRRKEFTQPNVDILPLQAF